MMSERYMLLKSCDQITFQCLQLLVRNVKRTRLCCVFVAGTTVPQGQSIKWVTPPPVVS